MRIKAALAVALVVFGVSAGVAWGQRSVVVTDSADNEIWFLDAAKIGNGISGDEVIKAVGLPGGPVETGQTVPASFVASRIKASPDGTYAIVTSDAKSKIGDTLVAGHHAIDANGTVLFSNLDYEATPLVQMQSREVDFNASGSRAVVGHSRNSLGVGVIDTGTGSVTTHKLSGTVTYPGQPLFLSHGGDDYVLASWHNTSAVSDLYKVSGTGTGWLSSWDLNKAQASNGQRSVFNWTHSPKVSDLSYAASFKSPEVWALNASAFDGTVGSLSTSVVYNFATSTNPLIGPQTNQSGWTNQKVPTDMVVSNDGSVMFVSSFGTRQIFALALNANGSIDTSKGPYLDGLLAAVTAPEMVEELLLVDHKLLAMGPTDWTGASGNALGIEVLDVSDFLDGNVASAAFASPTDNWLQNLTCGTMTLSKPLDADVLPEPATIGLLAFGFGFVLRRRSR